MADESGNVVSHWYQLIEGLQHSTQAFYEALEQAVAGREIPKAKTGRVEFSEGGVFSGKRLYFRVTRLEHVFDICAAPFGNGFFVSWWLSTRPSGCLASLPGIGWIFQKFVKRVTYYVIDTALMFQESVRLAVLEVIDGLTTAQGIRALSELERKPILHNILGTK